MKLFSNFCLLVIIISVAGCKKDNNLNKLPSAPVLVEPENGSVTGSGAVVFKWQKSKDPEGDSIRYILYTSKDSVNWETKNVDDMATITMPSQNFEPGVKYYWKVSAKNYFPNGTIPNQEQGESVSKLYYF